MADLMIILMYVAIAGTLGATASSLWKATRSREHSWFHNRNAVGVIVLVVVTMLLSWLIGGSVPDMFIIAIIVLFIVALLSVCLSIAHTKYLR